MGTIHLAGGPKGEFIRPRTLAGGQRNQMPGSKEHVTGGEGGGLRGGRLGKGRGGSARNGLRAADMTSEGWG